MAQLANLKGLLSQWNNDSHRLTTTLSYSGNELLAGIKKAANTSFSNLERRTWECRMVSVKGLDHYSQFTLGEHGASLIVGER